MKLSDVTGDSPSDDAASKKTKLSDLKKAAPEEGSPSALAVVGSIPSEVKREFEEGAHTSAEARRELVSDVSSGKPLSALGDVGKYFMGVGQSAFSPYSGVQSAVLNKPLERTIPQDTAAGRFATRTLEDLGGVFGPGAVSKTLGEAGRIVKEGGEALKTAERSAVPKGNPTDEKAAQNVREAVERGAKAEGLTAQQVLDKVNDARKGGKPMTIADVGGEDIKGMAGYVARQPGASREISRQFLNARDAAAAERLTADIGKTLASGSVRQTAEDLAQARSSAGKPLFEESMRGGSLAPLEHQFGQAFEDASKRVTDASKEVSQHLQSLTLARAEHSRAGADIYATAGAQQKTQEAMRSLGEAEARLKAAQAEKDSTLQALRGAQNDASSKAPGAVWSPRIARLTELPIVKSGIAKGIKLEQQNAAAEGRAFNAHEFAIKGFDESGDPIVGKVPNMRLLSSAKEGLDAILGTPAMRDPLTGRLTKEGVSVDKVRRALLGELDRINPAYKAARESWAGHSDSMEALRWGRNVFKSKPEDIAAEISKMTDSEKEFARLGTADILREKILRTGLGGDEAKSIIKSPWMREQLRPIFKDDASFNKFVDSVTHERTMFETRQKTVGGSQTAERAAEDQGGDLVGHAVHGAHGVMQAAHGNYLGALRSLLSLKRNMGLRANPELNEAVAKLLFDPDITFERLQPAAPKPGPINPPKKWGRTEAATGGLTINAPGQND